MAIDDQLAEGQRIIRCLEQIKKDNFNQDWYCLEFVRRNRNWLLDNMRSILTPSTVYRNRVRLMAKLQSVNGDLHYHKEFSAKRKAHDSKLLDFNEKEEYRKSLSPSFLKIMKLWKKRAINLIKCRSQVAGIMEKACQPYCEYCDRNWGLKCESIDNIEVVFHKFLDDSQISGKNYSIRGWNSEEWQDFFLKNVVFRTSCYACYQLMIPKPVDMIDTILDL